MDLDKDAIFTPLRGQVILITATNDDRKEVHWRVRLDNSLLWTPNNGERDLPWTFSLSGHIVGAQFFTSLDQRLTNQRESIDRLMNHLAKHCPQLMGQGSCDHMPV